MATCYRHPGRETGVSCSSCGRPICPDCMTPTPVGMRCPECARERTQVRTMRGASGRPRVTTAIIAINVVAFVVATVAGGGIARGVSGDVARNGWLYGPSIADQGEYWRLVTSGFLHGGLLHLAFNMYFIWILGSLLEPALGGWRFLALYVTCLLCGSFGALVVQPDVPTLGASGAAFGLLGAAIVMARTRGIDIWSSGLAPILAINLLITFVVPGIAIGAHIGGALGGFLAGAVVDWGEQRGKAALATAGCLLIGAAAAAASVAVAGGGGLIHGGSSVL